MLWSVQPATGDPPLMLSTQSEPCRRRPFIVAIALAVSLLATSCTAGSGASSATDTDESAPSAKTAEFCDALDTAFRIERAGPAADDAFDTALDLAPTELSATVEGIRSANQDDPSEQDMSHVQDLWSWMSDNCRPDGQTIRRIAPPTPPVGFMSCGDTAALPIESAPMPDGSMVIYSDASLDDPYQGTVISVVTGLLIGPGDAPRTEVSVRGVPAVTGPAGFFQGGGGPTATRVVAWEIDGVKVSIVGRGFDETRADELLAIAAEVELVDREAALPAATYNPVYTGSLIPLVATVPFLPRDADYAANYQLPGLPGQLGILSVNGLKMTEAEFGATRAFLVGSEVRTFHGRVGFVADGWNETGPFVAAWHEPDDLVVWIVGLGITKDQTIAAAEASTELTPEQWKETTRFASECNN